MTLTWVEDDDVVGGDKGCQCLGYVLMCLHDGADHDDVGVLHGRGQIIRDCRKLGSASERAGDVQHRLLGINALEIGWCVLGVFIESHMCALSAHACMTFE